MRSRSPGSGLPRCVSRYASSRGSAGVSRCGGESSRASTTVARPARIERRSGRLFAVGSHDAIAVASFDAGEPRAEDNAISGEFVAEPGVKALLALAYAQMQPAVLGARA